MIIKVEMGEGVVSKSPDIIVSQGIGSCVVLTLYDAEKKIGGFAHIMMPIKTEVEKMRRYEVEARQEGENLRRLEDEKKDSTSQPLNLLTSEVPTSYPLNPSTSMYQYANTAVPALLDEMLKMGASGQNIYAKIIGGAKMFFSYADIKSCVGEENIMSIKQILQKHKIPLAGLDVGGAHGRNVEFEIESGRVVVKAFGKENKEI